MTTEINIDYYEELKAKADKYDNAKVIIEITNSVIYSNKEKERHFVLPIVNYDDFYKLKEKAEKWDEKEKGADVIDNCICDSCSSTVNKKMIYCAECGIKLNWSE